jgi:hypothetical protein
MVLCFMYFYPPYCGRGLAFPESLLIRGLHIDFRTVGSFPLQFDPMKFLNRKTESNCVLTLLPDTSPYRPT